LQFSLHPASYAQSCDLPILRSPTVLVDLDERRHRTIAGFMHQVLQMAQICCPDSGQSIAPGNRQKVRREEICAYAESRVAINLSLFSKTHA
jgi:hypothetical protein